MPPYGKIKNTVYEQFIPFNHKWKEHGGHISQIPRISLSEVIKLGYRIDYQSTKKVRGMEKRTAPAPALAALGLLLFLLLVSTLWPAAGEPLRALVFPGEAAVTVAALEELSADLKAGENMQTALEGFCRQVMDGEGQP